MLRRLADLCELFVDVADLARRADGIATESDYKTFANIRHWAVSSRLSAFSKNDFAASGRQLKADSRQAT
jgi:hypothetical protein